MDNKILLYLLLIGILCTTSFCVYKVVRHEEIFSSDPLTFGLKVNEIDSCTCYKNNGDILQVTPDKITLQRNPVGLFD